MLHDRDPISDALHDAFASFGEGLLLLDADDGIIAFNREFERAWDLFGMPLVRSLTFVENLEAAAALGRAPADAWLAHRRAATGAECCLIGIPGGTTLEIRETQTHDGRRMIVCRDITAERAREVALAENEYRYRLLVETITEGVIVLDRDRHIVFANPRFISWFGGSDMALLGRPLEDLIVPESRKRLDALFSPSLPRSVEVPLACGGDEVRFVLISAAPLKGVGGVPSGQFAIITDVTQLRLATERLRQSEARSRGIIENTPFGILTLDAAGAVVTVNPAFRAIVGLGEGALVPDDATDWLPDAQPPLPEMMARLSAEAGLTAINGTSRLKRSADLGHARIVLSRIGEVGRGFLLIVEDITEQRQMEEALRHASKLALLGEMSASLAHEISQPLNVIRLSAESALLSFDDGDADAIKAKFETIGAQSDRLRETIDYMQAFSRRDAGPRTSFAIAAAIDSALALMAPQCSGLEIALVCEKPEAVLAALGHRRQLEQVLINLLRNAVDAIVERRALRPGPPDRITVTLAADTGRDGGRIARIDVSDTGTGIRAEDMPHLFDPFFTRKTEGVGTGLGLSISLGLMTGMGGRITAENRAEGGCRFRVVLPISDLPVDDEPPARPEPPPTPADADAMPTMTILVADDEPLAAEEIAAFLGREGHTVITAGSGRTARAALEAHHVDILITDLQMPDGDGRQLIAETAAEYPHVAIVVTTGQPLRDRVALAELESGVDAILRKPVSLRELRTTLRRLV